MQNNASLRHTAAARCETRRSSSFGSNSGPHAPAWIFRRNINQVTALLIRPTRKHWMREESSARYTRVMKLLPLLVECYSPISCSASAMFKNTRKTRVRKFARSGIAGTRAAPAPLADCSFACIRAGIPAAGGGSSAGRPGTVRRSRTSLSGPRRLATPTVAAATTWLRLFGTGRRSANAGTRARREPLAAAGPRVFARRFKVQGFEFMNISVSNATKHCATFSGTFREQATVRRPQTSARIARISFECKACW